METFEELQTLWQAQPTPQPIPVAELVGGLKEHSRTHIRIFAMKTAAVVLLLIPMAVYLRPSAAVLAGLLLVVAGAATTLVLDWRMHLALARLEFTDSSAAFAREAVQRLRRLERPLAMQYAALLLGPLAGLNVMEWTLLQRESAFLRIAAHAGLSLFAIAAVSIGFLVRRRRFEAETRPLLDRMQRFLDAA